MGGAPRKSDAYIALCDIYATLDGTDKQESWKMQIEWNSSGGRTFFDSPVVCQQHQYFLSGYAREILMHKGDYYRVQRSLMSQS